MAGLNYNPLSVNLGPKGIGSPYAGTPTSTARKADQPGQFPSAPQSQTIGAESIRATGSGPFDPAYRQNLATFAGGQFARPGGSLQFNPTGLGQGFGLPTGGGNAPLVGMPQTLLGQAQGGQPLTPQTAPPTTPQSGVSQSPATQSTFNPQNFWLEQYLKGAQGFGMNPPLATGGGAYGFGA